MIPLPLFLAHGAGAGHSNAFLQSLSVALSERMLNTVIPVTFSYMAEQEKTGKKKPPPKFNTLIPEYKKAISAEQLCIVAGKSMGARVATQLTQDQKVKAVICYGFPFYPSGKPEKHRLSYLEDLKAPCLIIQGTRDQLGSYEWVSQQSLSSNIEIFWVEGADHDFKTLKKYNRTLEDTINELADLTKNWLDKIL